MKKYFAEFIGTSFTGMGIHRRTTCWCSYRSTYLETYFA